MTFVKHKTINGLFTYCQHLIFLMVYGGTYKVNSQDPVPGMLVWPGFEGEKDDLVCAFKYCLSFTQICTDGANVPGEPEFVVADC